MVSICFWPCYVLQPGIYVFDTFHELNHVPEAGLFNGDVYDAIYSHRCISKCI